MIICSKFTHVFRKKICYLWQVGQMTCEPNFFSQNSKNYGNYSKNFFFQEKNNWEFAALKKNKSLRIKKMNISIFQIVQCCISYRNQSFDLRIIWFGMQIKWLVSIWGAKLCWNGLSWNLFISNRIYEPVRVRLQ